MSEFTLATKITGDADGLIRSLATAKEQARLFGKDVKDAGSSSSKVMGQQLPAAMGKATDAAKKFGTETRKSLREAEQATEVLAAKGGRNMSAFGSMLGKFGAGATVAALVTQIGRAGVEFGDFTKKSALAFETMLGSAEAATSYMSDLSSFADKNNLLLPDVSASAQRLIAFGVEANKVTSILQSLGDAAVGAGGGITELDGLSTVIGQISAKGRLQNEEILQLAERGIPALQVLANQADMTIAEFQKQVTKGAVDSTTAIDNLIEGLREGTKGVNGTTTAFDGLMAKQLEVGLVSANWVTVRKDFQEMSAVLVESLVPALIAFMQGLSGAMEVVKGIVGVFGLIPEPLQNVALAMTAVTIAAKMFGTTVGSAATLGVTKMTTSLRAMYLEQVVMQGGAVFSGRGARAANAFGIAVNTASMAATRGMAAMATGVRTAGAAFLGVFGGPVGLAVTGGIAALTAVISANANANAEAKSRLEEYKATLDSVTGAATEATEKFGEQRLHEETSVLWMKGTLSKDAEKIGLDLGTLADALAGNMDAIKKVEAATDETMSGFWDSYFQDDFRAAARLHEEMHRTKQMVEAKEEEQRVTEELAKKELARPKTIHELADAYREAQYALNGFNEEQEKAIEKYAQGFGDAFASAFSTVSGFKAVTVTAEEYKSAQEKVAEATKKVGEAQSAQNRLGNLRTTSKQRADAAKSVTEALKGQGEAYRALNELRAKDRPVGDQMKDYYTQTLKDAQAFSTDIQKLVEKGLDPKLIEDLVKKGPENAAGEMKAFLGVNGETLIELANQTEETLRGLNGRVVENARLTAIAMNSEVSSIAEDLPLAMKLVATRNGNEKMTDADLAKMLGVTSDDVKRVAGTFGLDWVQTVEEKLVEEYESKPWLVIPKWAVEKDKDLPFFLQNQADGAVIRPNVFVDPVYGIATTVEEWIRSLGTHAGTNGGAAIGHKSFATGGIMPGYTPGRDVHRFYSPTAGFLNLSGGEPIMRPEFGAAVGHDWIHRMNQIARTGGVGAVRNAMYKPLGEQSFASGGIFNAGSTQVVEVPVTSRVENHGTTIIEKVIANDPLEFKREMVRDRKRRNTL